MILVERVVTAARDRSPAFGPGEHPEGVILRFLSDYHRDLLGKVAELNPSLVARSHEVELPLEPFEEGIEIPAYKDVRGATAYRGASEIPVRRTEWENRHNARFVHAFYPHAGRLHLTGDADTWRRIDRVVFDYTPEPGELEGTDDELLLPDGAYLACVAAVAAFLGGRNVPPLDLTPAATAAEDRFLAEARKGRRARRIPKYLRR
jgi:hypothetical protein